VLQRPEGPLHVSQNRIVGTDGGGYGELVVVTDMSFVERRSTDTKKYVLYLFAAIATVVALITVIIAEISWRGWNSGLKALVKGETLLRSPVAWKSASPELTSHRARPAGAGARPRIGAAHARRVADELGARRAAAHPRART
jgi:trehalose 6-phosphate synthase